MSDDFYAASRRIFFAAAMATPLVWAQVDQARGEALPNIILCMADDQGLGDVRYNGAAFETPVLDEMAASGLRLNRFYAAAPVCSPTRGSVLTGRHPVRYACFAWGHTLRPEETTIAEALRTVGYTTGHFGKWHLGSVVAGNPFSPGENGFDEWLSAPNFYENDPLMSHNGKVVQTKGESSMVPVEAALRFAEKAGQAGKPFLAVIWFGSPHTPHRATDELLELYPDAPTKVRHYRGEVIGIDRAMGKLRKELREMGIARNTLVWYTSDNGARPPGDNADLRGMKGTLWEGGIRVPGIIEWPAKIPAPRQTDVRASTVDMYPTLLAITGAKVDNQRTLDGINLLPLIEGKMSSRAKPMGFWEYIDRGLGTRSQQILAAIKKAHDAGKPIKGIEPAENWLEVTNQIYPPDRNSTHSAWIDGDWKLHRIVDRAGKVSFHLFNLKDDPKEQHDLAAKQPQRVEEMNGGLTAWRQSVIDSLNRKSD